MIYVALWFGTVFFAFTAWIIACARAHKAREEGYAFGFVAGMETALETVKGAGQVVDPVHRAAQLDRAQRGLQ